MANDVITTTFDKEKYQELQDCYDLAKNQTKNNLYFMEKFF